MVKPLNLVKALDSSPSTAQPKHEKLKPRQERRKEKRDRAKAAKFNEKKIDRLSA